MHKKLEEPPNFWPMIRAFLTLKSDQKPLPVFDQKGRPIGLGKLWWINEQNQMQGKFFEGHLESPTFVDEDYEEDLYNSLYGEEWGEEVLMVDPARSAPDTRGHVDTLGKGNAPLPKPQIVWWEEVEEAAKLLFEHRSSSAGLQSAWHILIQQGYTQYANERERVRVLLRFVTLGFLWQTSQLPQQEMAVSPLDEYSLAWVNKLLDLSPFRLGWIAGLMNIPLPGVTSVSTEFELTTQLLPRLADRIRPEIVEILQKHFGGAEGLSAFFSQHFTSQDWISDDEEETDETLTCHATLQKDEMQAWVEKGCPFPSNLML